MISPADQSILGLFLNPGRLIFGGWEYMVTWAWTRRWIAVLLITPPLAVLLSLAVTAGMGRFRNQESMLLGYWEMIEAEIQQSASLAAPVADAAGQNSEGDPTTEEGETASPAPGSLEAIALNKEISPYLELLLLRVLDLDTSNIRASYWVARNLGLQGRQGQARWMMRRVAGEMTAGFAPAHAWLAADQLANLGINSTEDQDRLIHDLEVASRWDGSSPQLAVALAEAMASRGRPAEGLSALERAARKEPRLWLQAAELAHRYKRKEFFERAAGQLRATLQPRFDAGQAAVQDYLAYARLEQMVGNVDASIRLSSQALQMEPTSPVVRRVLSEAYRAKFQLAESSNEKIDLLDAALKADGTNPAVTEELARLISTGNSAPPRLVKALEEKLAQGQASALTHLLIANRKLIDGKFAEAISHLEISLKMAPNSPIILNNLALSIARHEPDNAEVLKRAESLMVKAIRTKGPDAELLDSLGEVRATANNHVAAIECYEAAIGIDGNRPRTRQRLAVSYRAVGLEDMARIQEQMIARNADQAQSMPPSPQPASTSAVETNSELPTTGETPGSQASGP